MTQEAVDIAAERRQRLLDLTHERLGKKRAGFGDDPKLLKANVRLDILELDEILGGGLRRGRIAIVTGAESMGKTLLAQWSIAAFQREGEVCALIDAEQTYEPSWYEKTGVNTRELIVAQPGSTEQAFDMMGEWSEAGMGLIVVDSLTALVPKARKDSDLESQEYMGLAARKLSDGFRQFVNVNTDTFLMCTNQLRSKIGVVYGSPDEMPGGRAQRHYVSYTLRVKRKGWIKEGDARVGYHMEVETQKNKLAPPYQVATVPFMFTGLVDTVAGTLDLGIELGVITGTRGFYDWNGQKIHGRRKLQEHFRETPADLALLRDLVKFGTTPVEELEDGEVD